MRIDNEALGQIIGDSMIILHFEIYSLQGAATME